MRHNNKYINVDEINHVIKDYKIGMTVKDANELSLHVVEAKIQLFNINAKSLHSQSLDFLRKVMM